MLHPQALAAAVHVLAFDTSTQRLAVALHTPGSRLHRLADGGALASATLLPHVHALLAQAGIGLAQLDCIAFGRGPGAFTGLRTACSVAQGLGFGLNKPLLPIDSLLIVAEDARLQLGDGAAAGCDMAVAMDARMDEVYAGRYRWLGQRWQVLQAPALYSLAGLAGFWALAPEPAEQVVAGSALTAFGPRLALPAGVRQVPAEHDRAAALLGLALDAALAGEGVDAAAALPLYLRDKVALTTHERDDRKQLAAAPALAP